MNDDPATAFNVGCFLALVASLMFWIVLVAGITWLVIR